MLWRPGILVLVVVLAVVVAFEPQSRSVAASFTLVGRVDGGKPSGAALTFTNTLVLVSDDSGSPTRYVIDLRWVLDSLPGIAQDDLLSIEIEVLPDGTLVATTITNQSGRQGTQNQGQSSGSRDISEKPRVSRDDDEAAASDSASPSITPSLTGTVVPIGTVVVTPTVTATGTVTLTLTPSVTSTSTLAPSATSTATLVPSATVTNTVEPSATPTVTSTVTATATITLTATATHTITPTATITLTPTVTLTPTATDTPVVSFTSQSLDPGGNVGEFTSLKLNSSGHPVVSYYDVGGGNLLIAICSDTACAAAPTVVALDSGGIVGQHTSLQLNSSGHPVVSYYDVSNGNLKLAVCGDAMCTSVTITTVDNSVSDVGSHTSLQLNSSGNPVISYYDASSRDLRLAVCSDPTCTTPPTISVVDNSSNDVGMFTSLQLNSSGNPVISYYDFTDGNLLLAVCADATCSTPPTITTVDNSANDVGRYTSLQLNSNGYPVISYYNATPGAVDLMLAVCSDVTCSTSPTIRTVFATGGVGDYNSLQLNSSGNPVISFYDQTNGDLRVAVCSNATCAPTTVVVGIDGPGNVGKFTSLQLDAAGRPVISYRGLSATNLKIAFCFTTTCAP